MLMTEYAATDPELRGTATNRWLQVQIAFCKQQQSVSQREKNAFLMLPDKLASLYDEIDRILPSLEYCLAPNRSSPTSGSSALRSGVAVSETSSAVARDPPELDRHAKIVYGWLDIKTASYIRTVQALLGHESVTTTMIYTHILNQGGHGVVSPLDDLDVE